MPADALHTPILHWTDGPMPWRDDLEAFYVLAGNGLYLCRNHEFYRSCTKARGFPGELEEASPFLEQHLPKVPQALMEQAVGFFSRVADEHGSEAGLFLVWNRATEAVELLVGPQTATVSQAWNGKVHAVGLHYDVPTDLPPELLVFGDVHCHVHGAAYASGTDVHDEVDKPGLHVVVGRITTEPPEVHAEIVVDGTRFRVDPLDVIEGYERRVEDVPQAWLEQVKVEDVADSWSSGWSKDWWSDGAQGAGSQGQGGSGRSSYGHGSGSHGYGSGSGSAYGQGSHGTRANGWNASGRGGQAGGDPGHGGNDGVADDEHLP